MTGDKVYVELLCGAVDGEISIVVLAGDGSTQSM